MRAERPEEAEQAARDAAAIRERFLPDSWLLEAARASIGRALQAQGKSEEAEPVLRAATEGLLAHEAEIPPPGRPRVKEAIEALVACYEALGRTEDAEAWRKRLDSFER